VADIRTCALTEIVHDAEPCAGKTCAYWQGGGDDLDSGCAIERLQLHHASVDVAGFLLEIRRRLEEPVT
jgi:hypothetical protein